MTEMLDNSALAAAMAEIVGPRHVVTDPTEMHPYLVEWRDLYRGEAAILIRPGSTEEVAGIVRLAAEAGAPIVPQGGNTGLVGGQTPFDARAVLLSLSRLDRLRNVDPDGNTMVAEAGVTLARAQEAAEAAGRLFPLSLASEGSCQIGGVLSTNAGGMAVLAYGNARDLALGLEVVLADGRIWNGLRRLRKDNTGYDLKHLFIGAEGTLGVITAAVLKLFPAPQAVQTLMVGVKSPADAVALLNHMQAGAGHGLTTFELVPRIGVDFVLRHIAQAREPMAERHDWYVLAEIGGEEAETRALAEKLLVEAVEENLVQDAVLAASLDQARGLRLLREALSEVQRLEGGSIKHDVSVPVACIADFITEASAAVTGLVPGARPVPFGHVGDGNVHFNVNQPEGGDRAAYLSRWDEMSGLVHDIVARHDGSISAEHGIGLLKRDVLPKVKSAVEMDLMRAVKQALDPRGLMNPGKLL